MNFRETALVIGLFGGCVATNACTFTGNDGTSRHDICSNPALWTYDEDICIELRRPDACQDPKREYYTHRLCVGMREDPWDVKENYLGQHRPVEDAGADTGVVIDEPYVRMGRCGPDAPNGFDDPEPVWFGPASEAPTDCPPKIGSFGGLQYSDLQKPTLDGCALCGCEPIEGTCSLPGDTIQFRNAMCGEAASESTGFGPVENWNGKCASDHAVVTNAECPEGSGVPCVQSFYASALPGPKQGCKPIEIPVPKAITDVPKWGQIALSCTSPAVTPSDALKKQFPTLDAYNTCVPGGESWRTCVRPKESSTVDCDMKSLFTDKIVTYKKDAIIDTRHCSACGCETSGGACVATINVYEDDACENFLAMETLDSSGPACDDLIPPGKAIGSKDLTSLDYVAGICKATGGTPQGDVVEDKAKASFWCCLTEESALFNIDLE